MEKIKANIRKLLLKQQNKTRLWSMGKDTNWKTEEKIKDQNLSSHLLNRLKIK